MNFRKILAILLAVFMLPWTQPIVDDVHVYADETPGANVATAGANVTSAGANITNIGANAGNAGDADTVINLFKTGQNIVLSNDVDLTDKTYFINDSYTSDGRELTIDLNGYTLTSTNAWFVIRQDAVKVTNGTIVEDGPREVFEMSSGTSLTLENVVLNVNSQLTSGSGLNITFDGVTVNNTDSEQLINTANSNIKVNNTLFDGNQRAINVTGTSTISVENTVIRNTSVKGINVDGASSVSLNNVSLDSNNEAIGIYNSTDVKVQNISVTNTSAENAVYLWSVDASITSSYFDGNTRALYAGGDTDALNITNSIFTNNSNTNDGGAVCVNGAKSTTITNSTFTGNKANNGGALKADNTSLTLTSNVFDNNSATWQGGAVNTWNTDITSTGNRYTNNTSYSHGGAVWSSKNTESNTVTSFTNDVFDGNKATQYEENAKAYGGAVWTYGANISMNGTTTFTNNTAPFAGAVRLEHSNLDLNDSTSFDKNSALEDSGALMVDNSIVNVNDNTSFTENSAGNNGGALLVDNNSTVAINGNTSFVGNITGKDAGALLVDNNSIVAINDNTSFVGNSAGNDAGAFKVDRSTATINDNAEFTGNTAGNQGGAVNLYESNLTINNGLFAENVAKSTGWSTGGGAIKAYQNTDITVNKAIFRNNHAVGSGGAINFEGNNLFIGNASDSNPADSVQIVDNTSYMHEGGGVAIIKGIGVLYSGLITGNKAGYDQAGNVNEEFPDWGGGGFFISDGENDDNYAEGTKGATLYIPTVAVIKNNHAGGFGGGVAGCSTGRIAIFNGEDSGAAIFSNTADMQNTSGGESEKHEDHDFALENSVFMSEGAADYFCALSSSISNALYQGHANWVGSIDGEAFTAETDKDYMINSGSVAGLTSHYSNTSVTGQVLIENNEAYTHGGGILSNGYLVLGPVADMEIGKPVEIEAYKTLIGEDNTKLADMDGKTFTFSLYEADQYGVEGATAIATGKTDENGLITFDNRISYNSETFPADETTHTYEYVMVENVVSDDKTVIYDESVYRITVPVEKIVQSKNVGTGKALRVTRYAIATDEDGNALVSVTKDGEAITNVWVELPTDEAHKATIHIYESFVNRETTSIEVTKVYEDDNNRDGLRKTLTSDNFVLLQNDVPQSDVAKVTKNTDGSYTVRFENLYVADAENNLYTYKVKEVDVPDGYTAVYATEGADSANNGETIVNHHDNEVRNITVKKSWADENNKDEIQPTSINVYLVTDGTKAETPVVLSAENNWTYTYPNLLVHNPDHSEIKYSFEEDAVEGYKLTSITWNGDKDTATLENKHLSKTSTTITAKKEYTDGELTAGAFTFVLKDSEHNVIDQATNDAVGNITFNAIEYTEIGTHTYYVQEVEPATRLDYVSYDLAEKEVVVTVAEEDGHLKATKSNENIVITNVYQPSGSVVLRANKVLTGKTLEANAFTFVLKDSNGKELDRKTNDASGSVIFDKIEYNKAGTYEYTIEEVDNGEDYIEYDEKLVRNVIVSVSDNHAGKLTATISEESESTEFENAYHSAGSLELTGNKKLTGKDLTDEEFTFVVKDEAGNEVSTGKNDADGNITFDVITYTEKDVTGTPIHYIVSEVNESNGGITYDETEFDVYVTLTDDGKGNITATYTEELTFENSYEAKSVKVSFTGHKTLEGGELTSGAFTFVLKDEAGEVVERVTNDADGTIAFSEIEYTEAGEFKYTISEEAGNDKIEYDSHEEELIVIVTDDLKGSLQAEVVYDADGVTFVNKVVPETPNENPKTGVGKGMTGWFVSFGLSIAMALVALLLLTKHSRQN